MSTSYSNTSISVGQHYADKFDYFFLGGDDLFVIPENLRAYLSTLSKDDNHFVGRRFHGYTEKKGDPNFFNSGGAGYTLSRKTLKAYFENLDDPICDPTRHTAMEDVVTAK